MSPLILLLAGLAGGAAAPSAAPSALDTLVEAERSFARRSVEKGVRASFLEFFAADGLAFWPGPENVHEAYAKIPAPASRPAVTLDWAPIAADVSDSGDFGWTTGPSTYADDTGAKPTRHGYYFSVWKKQADGAWKVVADFGTNMPASEGPRPEFRRAHAEPAVTGAAPTRDELLALDRELSRACAAGPDCLGARLHEGARLHREGAAPLVGREVVRAAFAQQTGRPSFEPLGGDAARSGDLAYTYGRYAIEGADGERGFYLRVWRRTAAGWKIAANIAKPEPPPAKP